MVKKITRDEFDVLFSVGMQMCTDMINALGMSGLTHPAAQVTTHTTDAWAAIANEYAEALDDLEDNGTL